MLWYCIQQILSFIILIYLNRCLKQLINLKNVFITFFIIKITKTLPKNNITCRTILVSRKKTEREFQRCYYTIFNKSKSQKRL